MRNASRLTLIAALLLACSGPASAALSANLIPNGDFESTTNLKMAGGNDNSATYIPIHRFNTDTDWGRWLAKWGPPSQADQAGVLAGFSTYDDPRDLNVVGGDTQSSGDLGNFNRSLDPTNPAGGNHVMENVMFRPRLGMWIHAPENHTTGPMSFSFDFNQFVTGHQGAWLNVTLYGLNFDPVHDTSYLVDNSPGNFMTPMSYDNAEQLDGALLAHFRFGEFLLADPPAGQDYSDDFGLWHTVSTDNPSDPIWQSTSANIITSTLTQTYQNYAVIIYSIAYGEGDPYFWLYGGKITDAPAILYDNIDFRLTLADARDPFSPGDMNLDGLVNVQDINPFVTALGSEAAYMAYLNGRLTTLGIDTGEAAAVYGEVDPNQSGVINVQDINTFVALLAGSGVDSAQLAAIPEPASLSLLALGALALIRRR